MLALRLASTRARFETRACWVRSSRLIIFAKCGGSCCNRLVVAVIIESQPLQRGKEPLVIIVSLVEDLKRAQSDAHARLPACILAQQICRVVEVVLSAVNYTVIRCQELLARHLALVEGRALSRVDLLLSHLIGHAHLLLFLHLVLLAKTAELIYNLRGASVLRLFKPKLANFCACVDLTRDLI